MVTSGITIMRARLAAIFLALMLAVPTRADPPKLAVFDFQLLDTRLRGEMNEPRRDEHERLMRAGEQLRKVLADSASFSC